MITLLRFLLKQYFIILFIILESFALFLVIRNNSYQNSAFNTFALNLNGDVAMKFNNWSQYLSLTEINEKLVEENQYLKNQLSQKPFIKPMTPFVIDTTLKQYTFIPAKIINNSTSKQYNYIILNKGRKDGIEPEMAVICSDGVVGIVHQVSEHFSQVMSVLNIKLSVSCKFKKNQYLGSFVWSGYDYQKGSLNNIPLHLTVNKGDTLITTGYGIFPEGIMVGVVSQVKKENSNSYKIDMKLSNDFRKLHYVYVVKDPLKKERKELEKTKE